MTKKKATKTPKNNAKPLPQNEQNFDKIKGMADAWSFSDNDVSRGESPKLIAKNGDISFKEGSKKWMTK